MSLTADSNTATRAADLAGAGGPAGPDEPVERALAAAVKDAGRIGDLLDVLRSARLWLPLPADGRPVITGGAVTLPTVSYLGSEFVPAYSSARLLQEFARPTPPEPLAPQPPADQLSSTGPAAGQEADAVPHVVVRAADLARLLPPAIGIALNAGAAQSLPVYPPGVSYLAAGDAGDDAGRISVAPLPVRPDALLVGIAAGLVAIAAVRDAAAAWLSVQLAGEGLLVAVTLDDPADAATRDLVVGAVERAAWEVEPDEAAFPIDVTFPGELTPDRIDEQIAAVGTPFYRRG
ncbi:MAG: SseB family protein [Streptosporangiaceae bacterium]